MTKITPTIAQTEKDSNTRRSDKVYNFEKPRNLSTPPNNITTPTQTTLTETLLSSQEHHIQEKANALLASITYKGNKRVILGKIQKSTEGRQASIGPATLLDFPVTAIQVVDTTWKELSLDSGYIYLIAVPEWNEEEKENDYIFTELELPWKWTLLPSNTIFQKTPNTWEEIGALIEKYQNALL